MVKKLTREQAVERVRQRLVELGIDDLNMSQLARRWGESPQLVRKFMLDPWAVHVQTALRFAQHLETTIDGLYGED